jgi:hypothetical protein
MPSERPRSKPIPPLREPLDSLVCVGLSSGEDHAQGPRVTPCQALAPISGFARRESMVWFAPVADSPNCWELAMARKSRTAVLKRQREARKAEKAAAKREKRIEREGTESDSTHVATTEELAGYGFGPDSSEADEDTESPPRPPPTRRVNEPLPPNPGWPRYPTRAGPCSIVLPESPERGPRG